MTKAYRERTEMLLQKAIDLRIFERKFSPEDNKYLTGFAPRFLETMLNRVERKHVYDDKKLEMYDAIAEYWTNISGQDGIDRLSYMAEKDTQDFRDMCDFVIDIMDHVYESSKTKSKKD